ncbi:MAG: hypothetical protein ACK4M9_11895 [Anaerobacillus sp.]
MKLFLEATSQIERCDSLEHGSALKQLPMKEVLPADKNRYGPRTSILNRQ